MNKRQTAALKDKMNRKPVTGFTGKVVDYTRNAAQFTSDALGRQIFQDLPNVGIVIYRRGPAKRAMRTMLEDSK